jgi:hypothetical protein
MKRSFRAGFGLAVLLLLLCSIEVAANDNLLEQATQDANAWLEMVDAGKYSETWTQTSAFFQKRESITEWHRQVAFARQPLGSVISRILAHTEFITSLPGAPDGQYVVLQYVICFAHRKVEVETLTMMLDADGQDAQWRVVDYIIQ